MSRDHSIPGHPEMDDWPSRPVPPFHIADCGSLRDPRPWCTFYVDLVDSAGTVFPFFFDRFLGRLCYGRRDDDEEAAFIRDGGAFKLAAFAAIESAASGHPEQARLREKLEHAKRYAGLVRHPDERIEPSVKDL